MSYSHIRKPLVRVAVAVALVLVAGFFSIDRASALPQNTTHTIYWDSAGEIVGERYIGCSGGNYRWGVTSPISSVYSESCTTGSSCIACYSNGMPTSCTETQCEVYGTSCSGATCW